MSTVESSPLQRAATLALSIYHGAAAAAGDARVAFWDRLVTGAARLRVRMHKALRWGGLVWGAAGLVDLDDIRRYRDAMLARGRHGYRAGVDQLGVQEPMRSALLGAREAVIGAIDQDGFVRSDVGDLRCCPTVSDAQFVPRARFDVTLVARDGILAIRKGYRGDARAFAAEARALDGIARAGCRVPALLDLDVDRLQIVMSYVPGKVLRQALVERGAVLLDRDVASSELAALSSRELRLARIREGRKHLAAVVDESFVEEAYRQIRRMHARRFLWGGVKYGNIVIEESSGKPFLLDFESAAHRPDLPDAVFRLLADEEIEKFNLHFGTAKPTSTRLRARRLAMARARARGTRSRPRGRTADAGGRPRPRGDEDGAPAGAADDRAPLPGSSVGG